MKNDPLLLEIQEEINRENMMRFANKYGKFLITAAVLAFLGIAAFQGWQQYRAKESAKTGNLVASVTRDVNKPQDEFALKTLDQTAKSAGYREISLMNKAVIHLRNNDYKAAIAAYDAVVRDSSNEKVFRDLAALNAANLLLNTTPKAEGIEKRLVDLTAPDNNFRYSAMELLAGFYVQNGDQKKADEVLSKLVSEANVPVTIAKRARELSPNLKTPALLAPSEE